jgi:hypothetical protein
VGLTSTSWKLTVVAKALEFNNICRLRRRAGGVNGTRFPVR